MSDNLKFPIIKGDPMPAPVLSGTAYLDFLAFTLRDLITPEKREEERKKNSKTPFKPFQILP